ncbi:disks large-associated protein 2 isoform X1 [Pangasianodon hypophthalmus]|uniref:disks large-associated protein 2 isoform X1 n=2 Tax=Pangasianodon hypophthalmus TaxID=310915 RepID=UPI0023073DF9|nr:disks large-associated protein 2 isoform X1 [Pangasianodon hypophthalmus]
MSSIETEKRERTHMLPLLNSAHRKLGSEHRVIHVYVPGAERVEGLAQGPSSGSLVVLGLDPQPSDQPYSWSPIQYFDEDSYPSPPRNMKGLSGGRPQLNITTGHSCGLTDCDHSLDHLQHGAPDSRSSYLLSPTESCPIDHHRCSPRSSIHSDCMVMPVSMASDHVSSSTFPRMHYSSHHESSREDGTTGHSSSGGGGGVVGGGGVGGGGAGSGSGSGKMNRIPANLLDQFEKQLPIHRDGFHTLQYQRTSTATTSSEQRNESPGRIRHLVHSVQKLFTKSHSLEGSSKMNGTKGDSRSESGHHHHGHHHGHHKHSKRSKSKERKADSKHRSGIAGWWSSDDNLDSDSTYRTPSVMSRHHVDHISHCYPESVPGHFGDLSLKTSKSNNDVKCSACEGMALAPEGKFMKRSSWSTLTVSQAKEAYRKSSLNLEKPMMPQDLKSPMRPCHYLQVPQDEWGGYPGVKDDEIPCRRMRSSSYVKAMGDEESGDSDGSPKNSPQKSARPGGLIKSVLQRQLSDQSSYRLDKSSSDTMKYLTNFAADLSQSYHLQASRDIHPSITLDPSPNYNSPKFRSRNQSYMRAVSTLSQASCVSQVSQVSEAEMNGQFESVCESVFSEVESQAMEALDLPGCFRTRSHSYLRAIQAGYSQDDECVPSMSSSTVTSTIRSTAGIQFRLPSSGSVDRPSQQPPAVTYTPSTPTYKRTPPPVPPRSASKPLISITAQSSTESTQDAYHEGRLARGGLWGSEGLGLGLGRTLYNSTDSLDSAKAVTIAMEAAAMAMAGKRHPSTDSHSSVLTCDKAILVSKAEEYLKTPRSSIGIQVEAATDSESESRGLREYHSVGIQVEDDKRVGRFKRSNSVTAAVQADLELEGFPAMEDKSLQFGGGGLQRHSEPSTPTQYGAVRTVRTQGLFSYRDDYRSANEPSSPQRSAEPWREPSVPTVPTVAVTVTPPQASDSGRASPSARRDGTWFMQLLHAETKRMEGWCKEMEGEAEENDLSEEILGKIRSAVGSAQLLMSQKFQQFYWLCQQNLDPSAMPRPTSQDLAGFWDLLQLSIDDVTSKFDELQKIKSNDWRIIESPVKKLPPPVPKKMLKKSVTREKSLDLPDRQRQEARRRLMAAKRAASFRQNSATERADSIEIYIPEAQTRL